MEVEWKWLSRVEVHLKEVALISHHNNLLPFNILKIPNWNIATGVLPQSIPMHHFWFTLWPELDSVN